MSYEQNNMTVFTTEQNTGNDGGTELQTLLEDCENMSGEEREEVLKAVALRCLASSFAYLDRRMKELKLKKVASQGPVQSVAGTSQQAQRPSVIFHASGVIDLTTPSNVMQEHSFIDLTTPPLSPSTVADETESVEGSPSPSSIYAVNGSKTVDFKTLPILRPIAIGEESRAIYLTTPPLPASIVADETLSVGGTTPPPSSSAVNVVSRTKRIQKPMKTKWNLRRLVRLYRGKRRFCCDKCQFKTQYRMPMRVHLDRHKLRRLNERKTCTNGKVTNPAEQLEVAGSRTEHTENAQTEQSDSEDQGADLQGSTENLCDNDSNTLHTPSEKNISVDNLAEPCEENVQNMHQCDKCSYKALTKHEVIKHDEDFHKNLTTYHCSECSYKTDNKRKLIRHCATHMKQNRSKPSKSAVNLIHLTQPMATSGEVKLYKCMQCDYKSKFKGNLKSHMRKHTNEKPFQCERCDSRFTWKNQLDKHMVNEHSVNSLLFNCGQCGYSTTRKNHLINHESIHSGEKPFHCSQCDYRASNQSSLIQHERRIHSGEKPFHCSQCDYRSADKGKLLRHKRMHSGEKPYHCKKCEFKTAWKVSLVNHKRIHSSEKPFRCSQCEYRTARKDQLIHHERIHSGDKPYHCKKCEFRTARKDGLVRHERIHSGDKPFRCSQCDYRAAEKCNLMKHKRIHSGEKPFHCSQCDYRATQKVTLTTHIRRRH